MYINKTKVTRLAILIIVILAELTLAACQYEENVKTTVKPDYEKLWGIDIGLEGFEIMQAGHGLVWKDESVRLKVYKSPRSLRSMFVNNYETRIENDRNYYFRDMVIAWDAAKSADSTGIDVSGTYPPYGREMQWEWDKYQFVIQAESLNGTYASLPENLVSIHTSQLIEKNFYQSFSDLKLQQEYLQVELNNDYAQINILFYPDAFGEKFFQDFTSDPTVNHVESEYGSYYMKYKIEKSSNTRQMELAWKTDKGIFLLFFFSQSEQSLDPLSSINMDFIKHISAQIDANII